MEFKDPILKNGNKFCRTETDFALKIKCLAKYLS
jgi:hypothetical protein